MNHKPMGKYGWLAAVNMVLNAWLSKQQWIL
jgi:hypothetical protein